MVKSFKKCGILNALDGSEDDLLWDDQANDNVEEEADVDVPMADEVDPYDDTLHSSEWEELFGGEDDSNENDFGGF